MNIINGTQLADRIKTDFAAKVRSKNLNVGLEIILIGQDEGSQT
jgi:5,10-methylene-tetrahydrofolate dehydrogenase/methenyl tetrahydrofolate cyclohydrolase